MDIAQLKEKLSEIKQTGYVVSLRRSDTGIGYTLETLLGLKENNLQTPDVGDIELKSQRNGSSNRVTMFTFNRGVWKMKQKELLLGYGYDDANGRRSLYCTVNCNPNQQGLYLKIEEDSLRLYHVSNTLIGEWPGDTLIDTFIKKMPALVIVLAETRINSDVKEEFWFNEAYFLTNPNQDNFLELIKQNIVIVEMRMHLKESDAVRNRGTGFRINERFLNLCFGNREQII